MGIKNHESRGRTAEKHKKTGKREKQKLLTSFNTGSLGLGGQSYNHMKNQMAMMTNWQLKLQNEPTLCARLKFCVRLKFCAKPQTVTAPVWKVSFSEKRYFIAPFVLES
jgi:hypothetical protein